MRTAWSFLLAALILAMLPQTAFAEGKKKKVTGPTEVAIPSDTTKGPKETDVDQIQEKYWARGEESEIGVVQNRLYTNKGKFEFGGHLGSVSSDPFLVNTSLGANVGYHFSDLFSAHIGFTKNFVGPSSALKQLETTLAGTSAAGTTAATNMQKYWLTADTRWSVLYGKVSLFGSRILYFDAYLTGGLGMVKTESGTYFALMPGIGQVFHITQAVGINLHYKMFWYKETILSKNPATIGNVLGTHENFGGSIMIGVTVTLDPFPAKAETEAKK